MFTCLCTVYIYVYINTHTYTSRKMLDLYIDILYKIQSIHVYIRKCVYTNIYFVRDLSFCNPAFKAGFDWEPIAVSPCRDSKFHWLAAGLICISLDQLSASVPEVKIPFVFFIRQDLLWSHEVNWYYMHLSKPPVGIVLTNFANMLKITMILK